MAKNKFVVSLMLAALLMLPVSAEVKLDDVTTPNDIFTGLNTVLLKIKLMLTAKKRLKLRLSRKKNTIAKDLLMQI